MPAQSTPWQPAGGPVRAACCRCAAPPARSNASKATHPYATPSPACSPPSCARSYAVAVFNRAKGTLRVLPVAGSRLQPVRVLVDGEEPAAKKAADAAAAADAAGDSSLRGEQDAAVRRLQTKMWVEGGLLGGGGWQPLLWSACAKAPRPSCGRGSMQAAGLAALRMARRRMAARPPAPHHTAELTSSTPHTLHSTHTHTPAPLSPIHETRLVDAFGSTRRKRQLAARDEATVRADRLLDSGAVAAALEGVNASAAAAGLTRDQVGHAAANLTHLAKP